LNSSLILVDNRIGQRSLDSLNRGEEVVGSLHGRLTYLTGSEPKGLTVVESLLRSLRFTLQPTPDVRSISPYGTARRPALGRPVVPTDKNVTLRQNEPDQISNKRSL
jgi:hypothetical protein